MAEDRQEKIRRVIEKRQEGVIVLEDIHDPHNAAAVWRSCEGMGFQKIYLIFDQEKAFNPKKTGKASSSSANKWLDFTVFKSTKKCVEELKKDGYTIMATVLNKEAKSLCKAEFKKEKIAIMLGNEHRGLSETAVKMADEKIYIPMRGMVQSYNLSVTAAIVMYEITRQRTGGDYKLSNEEQEEIGERWR
jgi:tRNA (guanosine-2'-O-)-methyltransferase